MLSQQDPEEVARNAITAIQNTRSNQWALTPADLLDSRSPELWIGHLNMLFARTPDMSASTSFHLCDSKSVDTDAQTKSIVHVLPSCPSLHARIV